MNRRDFLAAFGALALPFHARADDDQFIPLASMIRAPNPDPAAFQKVFKAMSGLKINATSKSLVLQVPNPSHEQEETLLSTAFVAQMDIRSDGAIVGTWNPERGKIINFLIGKGADINQELSGKMYHGSPRPDGKGEVKTRIFDRIATQALDVHLLKEAFDRLARPSDFDAVKNGVDLLGSFNVAQYLKTKNPMNKEYGKRCAEILIFFRAKHNKAP